MHAIIDIYLQVQEVHAILGASVLTEGMLGSQLQRGAVHQGQQHKQLCRGCNACPQGQHFAEDKSLQPFTTLWPPHLKTRHLLWGKDHWCCFWSLGGTALTLPCSGDQHQSQKHSEGNNSKLKALLLSLWRKTNYQISCSVNIYIQTKLSKCVTGWRENISGQGVNRNVCSGHGTGAVFLPERTQWGTMQAPGSSDQSLWMFF